MRIVAHDVPVLAGAGLRLVGVDHEVARATVRLLRHERPFQSRGKAGAATASQPGGFHLLDDGLMTALDHGLGAVPGTTGARSLQPPVMEAIEILEDAVRVFEHRARPRPSLPRRPRNRAEWWGRQTARRNAAHPAGPVSLCGPRATSRGSPPGSRASGPRNSPC